MNNDIYLFIGETKIPCKPVHKTEFGDITLEFPNGMQLTFDKLSITQVTNKIAVIGYQVSKFFIPTDTLRDMIYLFGESIDNNY